MNKLLGQIFDVTQENSRVFSELASTTQSITKAAYEAENKQKDLRDSQIKMTEQLSTLLTQQKQHEQNMRNGFTHINDSMRMEHSSSFIINHYIYLSTYNSRYFTIILYVSLYIYLSNYLL